MSQTALVRRAAEAGAADAQFALAVAMGADAATPVLPRDRDPESALQWLTKAATQGHAKAMVLLGRLAAPSERRGWLRRAAELEQSPEGMLALGQCYLCGDDGGAPDREQAVLWLERAVALGHAPAMTALADCFLTEGRAERTARAEQLLQQAADLNDADAAAKLGEQCEVKGDLVDAVAWWRRAAGMPGCSSACLEALARSYLTGAAGTARDVNEAAVLLRRAATRGSRSAAVTLSDLYLAGDLPMTTPASAAADAFRWHLKAAFISPRGRVGVLADMLRYGRGALFQGPEAPRLEELMLTVGANLVPPDADALALLGRNAISDFQIRDGMALLRRAAEAGSALGMFHLSKHDRDPAWLLRAAEAGSVDAMIELGETLELSNAMRWFRRAADKRDARAWAALGRCQLQTAVSAADAAAAIALLRQACDGGSSAAMLQLAEVYEKGVWLPASLENAAMWRSKAQHAKRVESADRNPSLAISLAIDRENGGAQRPRAGGEAGETAAAAAAATAAAGEAGETAAAGWAAGERAAAGAAGEGAAAATGAEGATGAAAAAGGAASNHMKGIPVSAPPPAPARAVVARVAAPPPTPPRAAVGQDVALFTPPRAVVGQDVALFTPPRPVVAMDVALFTPPRAVVGQDAAPPPAPSAFAVGAPSHPQARTKQVRRTPSPKSRSPTSATTLRPTTLRPLGETLSAPSVDSATSLSAPHTTPIAFQFAMVAGARPAMIAGAPLGEASAAAVSSTIVPSFFASLPPMSTLNASPQALKISDEAIAAVHPDARPDAAGALLSRDRPSSSAASLLHEIESTAENPDEQRPAVDDSSLPTAGTVASGDTTAAPVPAAELPEAPAALSPDVPAIATAEASVAPDVPDSMTAEALAATDAPDLVPPEASVAPDVPDLMTAEALAATDAPDLVPAEASVAPDVPDLMTAGALAAPDAPTLVTAEASVAPDVPTFVCGLADLRTIPQFGGQPELAGLPDDYEIGGSGEAFLSCTCGALLSWMEHRKLIRGPLGPPRWAGHGRQERPSSASTHVGAWTCPGAGTCALNRAHRRSHGNRQPRREQRAQQLGLVSDVFPASARQLPAHDQRRAVAPLGRHAWDRFGGPVRVL